MPYVEGRLVHDADAHIFEPPGWIDDYADRRWRDPIRTFLKVEPKAAAEFRDRVTARQHDPAYRARDTEEVLLRKGYDGIGAFLSADRPAALDLLGFASQLVFTTAYLGGLTIADRGDDVDLAYALAAAHNRGMLEFCSVDRRLLPTSYVPMADIERSIEFGRKAIGDGAAALLVASAPPRRHSPSHVGFDPLWAAAQEAGVPIVFHVGGGTVMDAVYKENGGPPVPDFTGGDGNFTSVSFMYIATSPMQTMATLIIDGVLERFPGLRFGIIEQGAAWLPGWMRSMDSAATAFAKNEERLQRLSLRPSEYVQRQVRVTPYPHEPAGWIVAESGPDICMFSSDYPHTEGGRNPLKRFDESMQGRTDDEKSKFYSGNFADLMGPTLERIAPAPAGLAADRS